MTGPALDLTMVLFHCAEDDLRRTVSYLADCVAEYRYLRVLVSGTGADHAVVAAAVASSAIADRTVVTYRFDNLGFAGGHNFLIGSAFADGAAAVLLMNPDLHVERGAISALLSRADIAEHALYGPALARLAADPAAAGASVDSLGIAWTRLGRHYDLGQGNPWPSSPEASREVSGITGACMLVPRVAFESIVSASGRFLDDAFLAYREDAELGIRAKQLGVRSVIVPVNGFSHARSSRGFERRNVLVNRLSVRNRFYIRWLLGPARPGNPVLSSLRDLLVVGAVLTVERSSRGAVVEAWRTRRSIKNRRIQLYT